MGFTYQFGNNPTIDPIRMLVSDTNAEDYVFDDREILMAYQIQANTVQSSMFFSWPAFGNIPAVPVAALRVAALLLDSLAANKARIAGMLKVLDVQVDMGKASQALRDQAQRYRDVDDESGCFMIIEQCNNEWSFFDRFWKQIQRTAGGAVLT